MLERARGCLEHGGRQLLRFPSEIRKHERLRSSFWSHGAGDLELSACWLATLTHDTYPPEPQIIAEQHLETSLTAGLGGAGFLDFLYPVKSLELLRKLNTTGTERLRAAARLSNASRPLGIAQRRSRSSASSPRLDEESTHPVEDEQLLSKLVPKGQSQYGKTGMVRRIPQRRKSAPRGDHTSIVQNKAKRIYSFHAPAPSQASEAQGLRVKRHKQGYSFPNPKQELGNIQVGEAGVTEKAAFATAQDPYALRQTTIRAVKLAILSDESKRDRSKWTDEEWKLQADALSAVQTPSSEVVQLLEDAISAGKVEQIILILLENAVCHSWLLDDKFQKICELCEEWRRNLSMRSGTYTPPLWQFVNSGHRWTTSLLIEKVTQQLRRMHTTLASHNSEDHKAVEISLGMVKAAMKRQDYKKIKVSLIRDLHSALLPLLSHAPSYGLLQSFLKDLLFSEAFRDMHSYLAWQSFLAMNAFGGYIGEKSGGPDLARRLFWRLVRLNHLEGMQQVFSNIQLRRKDKAAEYRVLLEKLSEAGKQKEFERILETFMSRRAILEGQSLDKESDVPTSLELSHARLALHRRRYDLPAMLCIFEEILLDPCQDPTSDTYNYLISAHTRCEDLGGAEAWLRRLIAAKLEPTRDSYLPIMKYFARRGDIDAVHKLTEQMERRQIKLDDAVVQCHLRALVLDGALSDARNLLLRTARFPLKNPSKLWDDLINAHAVMGNKKDVQSLLMGMKRRGINFTARTHASRMRMWCARNLPKKAEEALKKLLASSSIQPTAFHFAIVMKGHADVGDFDAALKLYKLMNSVGVEPDWSIKRILIRLLEADRRDKVSLADDVKREIRDIASTVEVSDLAVGEPFLENSMLQRDESYSTAYFQFLCSIAPGDSEADRVAYAWDAYVKYIESHGEPDPDFMPPITVVNRLLRQYSDCGMWERVDACWKLAYKKARKIAKDRASEPTSRTTWSRRYILCQSLTEYLKALAKQGLLTSKGRPLIDRLIEHGFRLDNRCWNHYIRLLLLNEPRKLALIFETTERTIMAAWNGWPSPTRQASGKKKKATSLRGKLLWYTANQSRQHTEVADKPRFVSLWTDSPLITQSDQSTGSESDVFDSIDQGALGKANEYAISDKILGADDEESLTQEKPADASSLSSQSDDKDILQETLPSNELSPSAENPQQSNSPTNDSEHAEPNALSGGGLNYQRLSSEEDSHDGRPEYLTLILLTRAFLNMRIGATFSEKTRERIRELSRVAPTVVQAILTMPKVDDELQLRYLRKQ